MIIYIAGPMTGLKDFNRPSFDMAASQLRDKGYEVRNPACLDTDWSRQSDYLAITLAMLRQCDAIVLLPGWDKSKGALIEKAEADRRGMPIRADLLSTIWMKLNGLYLNCQQP